MAIKTEKVQTDSNNPGIRFEAEILKWAQNEGIPKYFGKGFSSNLQMEFIITEVLGPSLGDLLTFCGGKFTLKTTCMLFHQLIRRFEALHKKGIVHCDIKPENILMGIGKFSHITYLIDYGVSNFFI